MNKIIVLLKTDCKNIFRDTTISAIPFAPILIALLLKFILPLANKFILNKFGFDITRYYDLIIGFMIMTTPMLYGFMVGFTLLDDRDEGLFNPLSVTPLGKKGYLLYKLTAPVILSFIFTYVILIVSGAIQINYFLFIPIAIMNSLEAPLWALLISAFASNKIEGLAFAKGLGIIFIAPIAGYFIISPLSLFLGIIPPYWIVKSFISLSLKSGLYYFYTTAGIIVHICSLILFVSIFYKKIE